MGDMDRLYALEGISPTDELGRITNNICRQRQEPVFNPMPKLNILSTCLVAAGLMGTISAHWSYDAFAQHHNTSIDDDCFQYNESDNLTTIDGFAVTDESTIRITIRSTLTANEKAEGMTYLVRQWMERREPAVYLWNIADHNLY